MGVLAVLMAHPGMSGLGIAVIGLIVMRVLHLHDLAQRDPQRLFDMEQKHQLRIQAKSRCEHKPLIGRRCAARGTQADHIVPWSKGGPTRIWNGQLLCTRHNRTKSNLMPSRFYRQRLARRRRRY